MDAKEIVDRYIDNRKENGISSKLTKEEMEESLRYMMNGIDCRSFEKTCGTYIGCMGCPYDNFRTTAMKMLKACMSKKDNDILNK